MALPRVSGVIHGLLFAAVILAVFARIWLPPALGLVLAAAAAGVFVINLFWLLFTRNLPVVRVLIFIAVTLAALLVFFAGLGVGLALNPAIGTALWIAAAAIFVLNIFWLVRAGRQQ